MTIAEYIWLGGNGELRSKTRVFTSDWVSFPDWDYDGSSTNQADGDDSEVILKPCGVYRDPFRQKDTAFLVLCATYRPDGSPLANNHREWAMSIFSQAPKEEPWYGLEQEYFLMDPTTLLPLGFKADGAQGPHYCSVGAENAFGRKIAEDHLQACLYAGLNISGINAEVAPGQWEFQVGPCQGIEAGDQLYVARYILQRVAESHGVVASLDPKPLANWNGSGCHTNFSTKRMREISTSVTDYGLKHILQAIEALKEKHLEHMEVYGEGNRRRLTGLHETSSYDTFTWGRADRGASVRIGNKTIMEECGYFEDRRPASNMNPYLVTAKIFETCVLKQL